MMSLSLTGAFVNYLQINLFILHTPSVLCIKLATIPHPNTIAESSSTQLATVNDSHHSMHQTLSEVYVSFNQKTVIKPTKSAQEQLLRGIQAAFTPGTYQSSNISNAFTRGKRNIVMDMVRVKLQAFIFEVQSVRPEIDEDARNQLQKFMNAYPHLLLDPAYKEKIIYGYNPLVIQEMVCEQFEGVHSNKHIPNTFFIVNDVGTFTPRQFHDRLHRLLFQITAALGIPSITWLPNRVGQFELDESQLAVRLEPLTWHVSHALVDFIHAFNWNMVIIVTNKMVSGSTALLEEMRNRRSERSVPDHPKFFEFEISHEFEFTGLNATGFNLCINKHERILRSCLSHILSILQDIWKADARVVIFNGDFYDLNTLLYIADCVKNSTDYQHLNELFGERYIWIFTPSIMSSLTGADSQGKQSMDNKVLKEFTIFRRIPGMFGLICLNDEQRRKTNAGLAREIWQKSLIELTSQLTKLYPPETKFELDSMEPRKVAYFRQILDKLKPEKLCRDSDHLTWQWGRRMFDIMRSLSFTYQNEPVSFLPNNGLNVSTLYVYNSRISSGAMDWHKVGTWSMSRKWGRQISRLLIDGVTWPGGSNSPPKGRPSKFKLRVVTIREKPFVIYHTQQEDGTCDGNSLPCKLRPQSMFDIDPPIEASERSRFPSGAAPLQHASEMNSTAKKMFQKDQNQINNTLSFNSTDYVDGCCSGLTMDLLMELMKDLNFDIELFEAPDGLWGAWTPDGWNGVIRVLMDNKADMAVTSLKITPNRSQQIEFSVPFLETGIAVTVALREGAISPTAFLKPYDYQSWCVILIFSVHASGAALFIFEWLSPNGLDRGRILTSEHQFTLFRSLWLIWSMLFGAAVNADNPRGVASRFLANIWALFALVFLASYTANLAAFMIAKEDYYDLSGMHDMRLQQPWNFKPPFRFSTIPSGATEENIKINFPEMSVYMRKFNRSTVEEGLASLKASELDAFIYDANVLDYWAAKDEGCKLRIVGNLYATTGYGIGFVKGSRWLEKVNSRILDYQKNGKLQRWKKFWQTGSCRRDAALGNTNKTLGVKNFISAFILLLCGILLCSLILGLEHIVYRFIGSHIRRKIWKNCCSVKPMELNQAAHDRQPDVSAVQNPGIHISHEHCNDPACAEQMKQLQCQATELQNYVKRLEALLGDRQIHTGRLAAQFTSEQGNGRHILPQMKIKVKPVGAMHEAINNFHSGLTVDNPPPFEQQPRGERRRQEKPIRRKGTASRNPKLWDIYSKVAVIPIEPSVPMNYACDSTAVEDEACTIILPRLTGSPNRRRRIATTSSLTGRTINADLSFGVTELEGQVIHQGYNSGAPPHPSGKENAQVEVANEGRYDGRSINSVNLGLTRLGLQRQHSNKSEYSVEKVGTADLRGNTRTEKPKSTLARHRKPVKHRELRFLGTAAEYVDSDGTYLKESDEQTSAQHAEHLSGSLFEKESVL
uniref:Glutamate receptor ionotropic, delta-2 n=1 Tax=Cryptocotyle lingua TaxID=66766 RepID=A0A7U0TJ98_9TREM|nr:glutamate receptor ionotropic, delta-2 [Cryptocotyle lingua]